MTEETTNNSWPDDILHPVYTCETCGFQWRRGEDDKHSCAEWLRHLAAYWEQRYHEVCHLQDAYAKYKIAEIIRLKAKIEVLEKMGASMSANQCLHPGGIIGDDGGSAVCPITLKRYGEETA